MENGPFIDDFPINTSIYTGFSMAMLNNQMVYQNISESFMNFMNSSIPCIGMGQPTWCGSSVNLAAALAVCWSILRDVGIKIEGRYWQANIWYGNFATPKKIEKYLIPGDVMWFSSLLYLFREVFVRTCEVNSRDSGCGMRVFRRGENQGRPPKCGEEADRWESGRCSDLVLSMAEGPEGEWCFLYISQPTKIKLFEKTRVTLVQSDNIFQVQDGTGM